jgi:hypothetical protein
MRRALNFVRTGVSGWTMMKTSEEEAEAAKARGGVCGRCHHRVELSIGAVPDCVLVQGELRHLSCFLSEVQRDSGASRENSEHSADPDRWRRF